MSNHLVIVESPTKAKTIKRFLGKDYTVHASMGHIRDLPKSTLAVSVEDGYAPEYEVPKEKQTVVKNLKAELKKADSLWIATDEDREGEAIGWHLVDTLRPGKNIPVKRIVFHEITEGAIHEAIANPRDLNLDLVDAQQARRVLDRLVGYTLSPFLWKKVYRGLSAGRVQSVAVRIIVDREREIRAFIPVEYWTIEAELRTDAGEGFTAELKLRDGEKFTPGNEEQARQVLSDIEGGEYRVALLDEKELKKNPPPPFTTSTLQQEAGRKLGFSVKQTMMVAQQLYEGISLGKGEGSMGLITYMRTDSVNLSEKALSDAKRTIEKLYGREYVLSEPRTYKTKSKSAQEAHEAVRPTEMERTPESLKDVLDGPQMKLYTLIWNRTMATQMPAAELKRVGADIAVKKYVFRATGQTVLFDGFMRLYSEGTDESDDDHRRDDENAGGEKFLPKLVIDQRLDCEKIIDQQHFTKPPPRYTEASLVKKLEEEGIGRPSTYAPTISTVQQRGYIRKDGKQLIPEDVAFTVTDLLAENFVDIVDLKFTAQMEQSLDDIAEGNVEWESFIDSFYKPFAKLVSSKTESVKKEDVMKERVLGTDPETGLEVLARSGRFGPYVQLGRAEDMPKDQKPRSASLPKGTDTESATLEQALDVLRYPKVIGKIDGEDAQVALGRFGPYLKIGKTNVSIPADIDFTTVDLNLAKQIVSGAAERAKKQAEPLSVLGKDPISKGEVLIKDGRFGPYITDGKTNVSLGKKLTPADVTLELAAQMLEKKRHAPKRAWGKKAAK